VKFMDMPVFKVVSLLETLKKGISSLGASRVVIDSVSALTFQVADPIERRLHTMLLFKTLLDSGCTSIVISEAKTTQLEREFIFEEYLADGVIVLQNIYQEGNVIKCVYVEKLRGMSHDTQPRPYRIDYGGITVFPRERVFYKL
ncbi:MAG: RAD55 family ATPase, partial [Candidatus Hecatellaceae archaeon]